MKTFILIPAFNAGQTIGMVLEQVKKLSFPHTILVINDGSTDDTGRIARQKGAKVINHVKNFGKGMALRTGFDYCRNRADVIITLDADNQHDARLIPKFLQQMYEKKSDIVIGCRSVSLKYMPWPRVFSNYFSSLIISFRCGQKITDSQCGFRAITEKVLHDLWLKTRHFDTESELLIQASMRGYKIGSLKIQTIYPEDIKTSIRPLIDTVRFLGLLVRSLFWY